ncbi:MAG: tetratricopeptide repeat protein [Acidobacteriota bacterium]
MFDRVLSRKAGRLATVFGLASMLVFVTTGQEIGHLGIDSDPTPLVQARRASKRRTVTAVRTVAVLPATGGGGRVVTTPGTRPVGGPPTSSFDELMATAEAASKDGQYEPALESYRRALQARPDSIEAKLGLAETLLDARKYGDAEQEFRQLLRVKPQLPEAQRGLGDTVYELKRYSDAVAAYQTAAQGGLNDAELYNNYANSLFRTGTVENKSRAIEYYRKAIQLQPDWPSAYAGLANLLRTTRGSDGKLQLTEALAAAKKAVDLNANFPLGHSILGRVYADLGDFTRAGAEGQRAIELAPKDPFVFLNMGGIYYAQRRYPEAEQAYLKSISLDPQWAFPYHSLGTLYLNSMNRLPDASMQFSKAILLEPNSPTLRTSFGASRARSGDYNEAANQFKKAIEIDPKYIAAYHNLGVVYAINRRYPEALEAFKKATELDPTRGEYFVALGDIYKRMGRDKESQEAFQRASALGAKVEDPGKGESEEKGKKNEKSEKTDKKKKTKP